MEPILDLSRGLIQYGGKPCVVYLFGPDRQEWFDCRCIAEILDIAHLPTAMQRVDPASKSSMGDLVKCFGLPRTFCPTVLTHHDLRSWVVDEAGFYELAMGSRKANAVAFRRWICRTVLPSIRRFKQFDAVQHVMAMTPGLQSSRSGMVYVVTSPHINVIKLGRWGGTEDALRKRYQTYYGPDLELYMADVEDCCRAEREMLRAFEDQKASGELFCKKALVDVIHWLSTYPASGPSLKRKAEAEEDRFTKRLAVCTSAVEEMRTTTSATKLVLENGDDEDKAWALCTLKRALILKDTRIDTEDRKHMEIRLSDVALSMGYSRKTVQPALSRIGLQVRRQWNKNNPGTAAEGPFKRQAVYGNKVRIENVYYESDRSAVEEGIRSALGDLDDQA